MARFMERFWGDDKGSDLVDWMVLTAGLLMLAVAIVAVVDTSRAKMTATNETTLSATGV